MRFCIYGGGAVGLGLASFLIKAGAEIDIIARQQTVDALKKDGLIRTGIFGDFSALPRQFDCFSGLNEIQNQNYDFILVCTKSFDSQTAAGDIFDHKHLLGRDGKIVLFQNGWGNAEKFLRYFEPSQVYSARVITGFARPAPNRVDITVHAEAIHIGSLFGSDVTPLLQLCDLITKGGIDCRITDSIEKDLWAKLLYNCLLNPLGAILAVPYGKLAEADYTRKLMNALATEIFAVMKAAGYSAHWNSADDFLEVFYARLVPDTARHKSSTLQDIAAGKQTEIDALNGAVIALAEKYNIETPCNRTVYNLVKFMELRT